MKHNQRSRRGRGARTGAHLLLIGAALLAGACGSSDDDPVELPPDPLLPPASVTVETGDGTATLTWDAVQEAATYNLYWSTEPGLTKLDSDRIAGLTAETHTLTGLQSGESYSFAVTASDATRESELSTEVSATLAPGMVEVLTIEAGDALVTITWDEVYGASSYNLYWDNVSGVTKDTGNLMADVSSPFLHDTVLNGETYYYVVTALGPGGEGPECGQVSAQPKETIGAPRNPAVTLVEEAPRTLLVSWDPPDIGTADSYNVYWDTQPGVSLDDNELADVESPYLHTGLTGNVTYYYVVVAVRTGTKSPLSAEVSATPHGGGGGGGGGHTEGYGNNLSFPLVFADGYGLGGLPLDGTVDPWLDHATGLRPTADEVLDAFPHWDPDSIYELNGVPFYEQQTASTWQADWVDGSQEQQEVVLDWGDNLSSVIYRTESMIRVETVLYQDTTQTDPADTLTAFEMALLHGSGATEMQGTNQHTYESNVRHVYAVNARLRIQKLQGQGGAVDETVNGFDAAVYEGFGEDGPGSYGSEVNVGGKVVYGYVWMLRMWNLNEEQKRGWWRITFSLDPVATYGEPPVTLQNNVTVVALDPSETVATLDDPYQSSIEIEITD